MPRAKQVKITKDGQVGRVNPESVAVWERHGWTRADDGSSKKGSSDETEHKAPVAAKKATSRRKAQ